jgi:AcrR family transcriptional regulator
MRKLAARCGYTAPTIYHYFGDKPGLLDELLDARMKELGALLREIPVGADPVANLRALYLGFAAWGLANPTHYQLLTVSREPIAPPLASGEEVRAMLEQPITEIASRGWLRMDLETAQQSFWGLLHGLMSLQRVRPDVEWADDILVASLDAMIRGTLRAERG